MLDGRNGRGWLIVVDTQVMYTAGAVLFAGALWYNMKSSESNQDANKAAPSPKTQTVQEPRQGGVKVFRSIRPFLFMQPEELMFVKVLVP